jgi:trk system potassium uptake protein
MKIIIAGAGEVGTHLAKMLSTENHDIIVIDPDAIKLQYINNHFDILTIKGSAASIEILKEADIHKADLFVAVTPTEELNIIASILGKKLGAKMTISRIDNQEYLFPKNKKYFFDLGIDSLIYPEKLAANEVINLLNQTGTTEIVDFSGGLLSLYVIKLDEHAPIINQSMVEASNNDKEFNYRAVAIHRNGKTIIPRGSDVFMTGDLVHVITNKAGVKKLMEYSGKKNIALNNLMIIGGSRIGRRVARKLQNQYNIKLIEYNRERSVEASDLLHNTLVINGDGRNIDLLIEEGVKKMDALIAVTENSETNILSCLAGKRFGIKKTIAEIENIDYIDLAENIEVDTIINKKLIAASHIYAFTLSADVQSVRCLTGTDADVLEFVASPGSRVTRSPLRELNFPEDAIIGGVIRNNESIIAKGSTQIKDNDNVVVFALPSEVKKIEKYFN